MTNDISKIIGSNINKIRTSRGYTLQDLSDELMDIGCEMSPQTLSRIENGRTRIYADQLFQICTVLGCSYGSVIPKFHTDENEEVYNTICNAPKDVKDTLFYILKDWRGNSTALWKFVGVYACLPVKIRVMIAGMGISAYNYAKTIGKIDSCSPPVDITYVTKEYKKLL